MDDLFFADEKKEESAGHKKETWKILLADDEPDIHSVTKLVLKDVEFEGKGLEIISSYSEIETKEMLMKNSDIAVILLDVVMDNIDSGLRIAKYIRTDLKNNTIRIILRTGQPGMAPERTVITEYDINDYKEKTELTAQKLFTTVVSAIRSYRDILTIERSKKGLEKIVQASSTLFVPEQKVVNFAEALLEQLSSLTRSKDSIFYFQPSSFVSLPENGQMQIVAATGEFRQYVYKSIEDIQDVILKEKINDVSANKNIVIDDNEFFGCFESLTGAESIIYFKDVTGFSEVDKNLLKIFSSNISIALNNMFLNEEILNTQKEIIMTLGEVVETRSQETGHHVKRVGDYSYYLGLKCGLSEDEAETLRSASPMHDIGKIGIPDSILNKPSKLTYDEFEVIKTHTEIGYNILKASQKKILQAAAIIAYQHHERWNGGGYPRGLKGEEIHIYGRITAICDVFDALSHKRIYKQAWELDKVIEFIRTERGKMFDPHLVDIFLENIDEILDIKANNND